MVEGHGDRRGGDVRRHGAGEVRRHGAGDHRRPAGRTAGPAGWAGPLDADDPRFGAARRGEGRVSRPRALVASRGPGASPMDPRVRILRIALPGVAFAGVVVVVAMFFSSLDPDVRLHRVGPEATVRDAVADRPLRVCYEDAQPCAWLTEVDGELLALATSGPLPDERGRLGVGWCPSSGYYGADRTGSRYDPLGRVVEGPAPRGLDRYRLETDAGDVVIDFTSLRTGRQAHRGGEVLPPGGPDCESHGFDPAADLPRSITD